MINRLSRSRLTCRSYLATWTILQIHFFNILHVRSENIQVKQRNAKLKLKFTILHLSTELHNRQLSLCTIVDCTVRKRCLIIIEPTCLTLLKMVVCAIIAKKRCIALTGELMIMVVADSGRYFTSRYIPTNKLIHFAHVYTASEFYSWKEGLETRKEYAT